MIPSPRLPFLSALPFHYSLCYCSSCPDDIISLFFLCFTLFFLLLLSPFLDCTRNVVPFLNKKCIWFYKQTTNAVKIVHHNNTIFIRLLPQLFSSTLVPARHDELAGVFGQALLFLLGK